MNKKYPSEDEDLIEHIKSLLDELGEDDPAEGINLTFLRIFEDFLNIFMFFCC